MMLARAAAWTILACYFPQGKGDKKKGTNAPKPPFFATIMDVAAAHTEEPLIVIGDVNNGHRDRDREGSKFVGPEDFEALSLKSGLVDLWRLTNGDDAREYSWMSAEGRVSKSGNGFRINHAFANNAYLRQMRPICHYDHRTRVKVNGKYKMSDHSALVLVGTHDACSMTTIGLPSRHRAGRGALRLNELPS